MPNRVQMWKLVLGIAAVVCVQFAFVSYMSLRSYFDLAVGPVHVEVPSVESDLTWTEELDRSEEYVGGAQLPARQVTSSPKAGPARGEPTQQTSKSNVNKPAQPKPFGLTSAVGSSERYFDAPQPAPPVDFEAVVIRYNRDAAISNCDSFESTAKASKRSFIAKAVPAAKKPWGWLKSIGSKLY